MKNNFNLSMVLSMLLLLSINYSCTQPSNQEENSSTKEVQVAEKEKEAEKETEKEPEKELVMEPKQEAVKEPKVKKAIDHYICYRDDSKNDRMIWMSFTDKGIAIEVKYKGQTKALQLEYDKEEFEGGGANPNVIKYYTEMYEGKKNGTYKTTHSGIWDYVEYTRGKDGKVFKFTIDHDLNPYGKAPCF